MRFKKLFSGKINPFVTGACPTIGSDCGSLRSHNLTYSLGGIASLAGGRNLSGTVLEQVDSISKLDSASGYAHRALEFTLSTVTVTKISPMPKICRLARLSFKTTTPNSDAVTGSTIATIEATAGAVWFRPTM